MSETADRFAELEARVGKLTATLAAVVNYLDADLKTSHLESRKMDATAAGLEELSSRVKVLELARARETGNVSRDELARRVAALELDAGLGNADPSRAV